MLYIMHWMAAVIPVVDLFSTETFVIVWFEQRTQRKLVLLTMREFLHEFIRIRVAPFLKCGKEYF